MHQLLLKTLLLVFIISTVVSAQKVLGSEQNTENALEVSNEWDIKLTPYLWAAELKGDATLLGRTGSVDVGFSDIMDKLDISFMGQLEAWKGDWGFFLDILYMDLGASFKTPLATVSADGDFAMTMLEFGVCNRLFETRVGQDAHQKLSFDLLGGGRYMSLDGEIEVIASGPLSDIVSGRKYGRKAEWVDPLVGGRLWWHLNNELAVSVRFDFGGFDIGEGSNLTWNLIAGISYQLKENMHLRAGYRIFDLDWDRGSGTKKFGMDAQFRGPIFGLTVLF